MKSERKMGCQMTDISYLPLKDARIIAPPPKYRIQRVGEVFRVVRPNGTWLTWEHHGQTRTAYFLDKKSAEFAAIDDKPFFKLDDLHPDDEWELPW